MTRRMVGAAIVIIAASLAFLAYRYLFVDVGNRSSSLQVSANHDAASTGSDVDTAPRNRTDSHPSTAEPDLYEQATALLAKSDSGDAAASFQIASIYQDCWQYAADPIAFDADLALKRSLRKDLAASLKNAGDILIARCHGFAGRSIGSTEIRRMMTLAAQQGSLAAQTQLFADQAMSGVAKPDEVSDVANKVLISKDADAFAALAPLMGRPAAGYQAALKPIPAGTDLAEAAWSTAACRLGRDCSSRSSAVIQMCLGGGVNCQLQGIESFYRQAVLPPAEANQLGRLVEQLIQGTNP